MSSANIPGHDRLRQFLTVFAIWGAFGANALSNVRPLNGQTIGQISNTQFANVLITPANYAFAIWGVIYLGLIGFSIYQFLPVQKQHPNLKPISYLLVLACVAQSLWVYVFLSRWFGLSAVAMVVILLCLIGAYWQLGCDHAVSRSDRWLLRTPFSIYLGWISVATIVNIALALYDAGWNGWNIAPELWTALMLVASTVLGIILLLQRQDIPFSLVLVWAFLAIAVKQFAVPLIALPAIVLSSILLGFITWTTLGSREIRADS